jgi:CheY-like chemotaxis protein
MEAVGVRAGGIAHDFNNLLTAINGYSSLTLKKMAPGDPFRHNIEEVKNAGDRAAELTSQLLAFSRKQIMQPVVINLNSVVSNIEKMLRRIIRESIELRFVLDPELSNIKADPGQIEQVLMNLTINARDAMSNGGTLTVETQNVLLDEHYVGQHVTVAPGEFIKMTVTDTGQGMSAETQSHIFEPFFTTKDIGKGTGLGLSTVYGIIKQSGGDIRVYSEEGHGTTFKIYLPCVGEPIQKRAWATEVASGAGTETILLVEDEDIVRIFVRTILSENGYTVLEASNGNDALALARTYIGPIHMLLTDLIMPKMSGTELKDQLFVIRPDIRPMFMSGYTDESISHQGILNSGTAFIEKPFSPEALFRKVREVLEA